MALFRVLKVLSSRIRLVRLTPLRRAVDDLGAPEPQRDLSILSQALETRMEVGSCRKAARGASKDKRNTPKQMAVLFCRIFS